MHGDVTRSIEVVGRAVDVTVHRDAVYCVEVIAVAHDGTRGNGTLLRVQHVAVARDGAIHGDVAIGVEDVAGAHDGTRRDRAGFRVQHVAVARDGAIHGDVAIGVEDVAGAHDGTRRDRAFRRGQHVAIARDGARHNVELGIKVVAVAIDGTRRDRACFRGQHVAIARDGARLNVELGIEVVAVALNGARHGDLAIRGREHVRRTDNALLTDGDIARERRHFVCGLVSGPVLGDNAPYADIHISVQRIILPAEYALNRNEAGVGIGNDMAVFVRRSCEIGIDESVICIKVTLDSQRSDTIAHFRQRAEGLLSIRVVRQIFTFLDDLSHQLVPVFITHRVAISIDNADKLGIKQVLVVSDKLRHVNGRDARRDRLLTAILRCFVQVGVGNLDFLPGHNGDFLPVDRHGTVLPRNENVGLDGSGRRIALREAVFRRDAIDGRPDG